MTYFAMARRYRPQVFADVAAQDHITETLQKALETDRVASAYLFTGPRGSGKTTVARLLAKAVNCDKRQDGEPCGKCEPCVNIAEGRSMDVLEIDGASNNSVEDVRELRENVRYAASQPDKRKVYIIDEVHMLSAGAFNALLKTLEEPPAHVLFVFATTEAQKVPQTILSRCQRFDFRRLLSHEIQERLQRICKREKVKISDSAQFMIAKRADGSLRDGLSLLDQVLSSASGAIDDDQVADVLGLVREETYLELSESFLNGDSVKALQLFHASMRQGTDAGAFALGLVEHLRNLLLLSVDESLKETVQLGEVHLKGATELAKQFQTVDLLFLLNRAAATYEDTRRLSHPVVVLEAAMVELACFESRVVLREVLDKLEDGGEPQPEPGRKSPAASRRPGAKPPRARRGEAQAQSPGPGRVSRPEAVSRPEQARSVAPTSAPVSQDSGPAQAQLSSGALTGETSAATWSTGSGPATAVQPSGPGTPTLPLAAMPSRPASHTPTRSFAAPLAGELDLGAIREHWANFAASLRGTKAMLAHCISEGRPASLENDELRVHFDPEHSFHINMLADASKVRELESQLQTYFHKRLRVRFSETEAPAPPAALEAGPPPPRLSSEDVAQSRWEAAQDVIEEAPRMKEILDLFEGEILEDTDTSH